MILTITPEQRVALEALLDRPDQPDGTLTYRELQGFVFALACAPELVAPSEWIARIFGDRAPAVADKEEAQELLDLVMALYNEVNLGVVEGQPTLPPDCAFREELMANLDPGSPIGEWCAGFRMGHMWLVESWDELLPSALEGEYAACVTTLTFFESREMAEATTEELGGPAESLEENAKTFRQLFAGAMESYAEMGRAIYLEHFQGGIGAPGGSDFSDEPGVPVWNEPCPCGSGRNFGACCGRSVH